MVEPIFWLGLSILLVAVSITAVLVAALPAFRELARAARSAEKLFDTLSRELPPTLEAIRLTGLEITDLTDDVSEGVQSAGQVVKQVDQSIRGAKKQARQAQVTTRSVFAGVKAAWKTLQQPSRRAPDRLPASPREPIELDNREAASRDRYSPRDPQRTHRENYASEDYAEDWEPLLTEEQEATSWQANHSTQDSTNWEDENDPAASLNSSIDSDPPLDDATSEAEESIEPSRQRFEN